MPVCKRIYAWSVRCSTPCELCEANTKAHTAVHMRISNAGASAALLAVPCCSTPTPPKLETVGFDFLTYVQVVFRALHFAMFHSLPDAWYVLLVSSKLLPCTIRPLYCNLQMLGASGLLLLEHFLSHKCQGHCANAVSDHALIVLPSFGTKCKAPSSRVQGMQLKHADAGAAW